MSNKNFKVKNGLDVNGSITVDSDLIVSGTITGDGSGLTGVTAYDSADFLQNFAYMTTDELAEGDSDLYYTSERADSDARHAISVTGDLTYNTETGVIGSTAYTGFDSDFGDKSTDYLTEGSTNLYYSSSMADSDAKSAVSASGDLSYNSSTGEFSVTTYKDSDFDVRLDSKTTSDLTEGDNLYYTSARVDSDIDARVTGGTGVTVTSGEVAIGQSVGTTDSVTFGSVTADSADIDILNLTPVSTGETHEEGKLFYDNTYKCLVVYNEDDGVHHKIGRGELVRFYNNTGATLTKGTVVSYNSAIGGWPTVYKADASNYDTIKWMAGLIAADVEDASYGYIATSGAVVGIDTGSYSNGDQLYVSTTAGEYTDTAPGYPNYAVTVGGVLNDDSDQGVVGIIQGIEVSTSKRIVGDTRIGGNLVVEGDLSILGTQSTTNVANFNVADNYLYIGAGDTVDGNLTFLDSGLDDLYIEGHYTGESTFTAYVKIDGTSPDTFAWSKDISFSSPESTGVTIDPNTPQLLQDGLYATWENSTGHTLNDMWSFDVEPQNVQLGIVGNYNNETEPYAHTGLFRCVQDERWKFFQGYQPEVEGSVNIADSSFEYADIQFGTGHGNLVGSVTGNVTGNTSTATALANARNFSITGDVTASAVSFSGTGNVVLSADISNLSDTNLATISTSGKVANSATTATSSNTASAIVARDVNGDFVANDITVNDITAGDVTADAFIGDGSQLTGVTSYVESDFSEDFAVKTTDDLTEGSTNLYYSSSMADSDAKNAISVSGDLSYNSGTGVISFTERTDAEVRGLVSASGDLSYNSTTGAFSFTERTDGEVRDLLSGDGDISYNNTTGVISVTSYKTADFESDLDSATTDDLSEGSTNQYFTNTRARSAVSAVDAGGYGSFGYNSTSGAFTFTGVSDAEIRGRISVSGDLSYNSSTGVMSFSETYSTATELMTALKTVDSDGSGLNASTLGGEDPSYYRIDVYDNSGALLN